MRFVCASLFWAGLVFVQAIHSMPLPPPLETAHLLGKGLPAGNPPIPVSDELYALGWSRKNAFSILERRDLGNAEKRVFFRVLDLVEDRTLLETSWADWGAEEQKAAWWESHQGEVDAAFAAFDLKPTTWQLGVFPLILDNEYYTWALRTDRSSKDQDWINHWAVLTNSTGRGLKIVSEAFGYWQWATLLGFLPSPFENRLAVVLLVQPSGWLGKTEPLRFVVAGMSLKAGFSKP